MKLQIKKGLLSWNIIDDDNIIVAKIKRKRLFGSAKNIVDNSGKIVFTTEVINIPTSKEHWNNAEFKKYIVCQNNQPIATATFSFAKNPEQTKLQKATLRPPQIDAMEVDTPYGVWQIKRQRDNSIAVKHENEQLGTITPFFSLKRIYLEHNGKYDTTFWTSIYMLVEYMMHEDDLIV